MIRQLSLIIFAIFVFVFIIAPAKAEIKIVLDELSPQPVEPGHDLVLSVRLENEGDDIENLKITIVPDTPIILKNENDRTIDEGRIIKLGAVAETYLLHVDANAVSGAYEIEFRVNWLGSDQKRETNNTFKVMVRGAPQLVISNITVNPERISPKDVFDLAFTVSNEGTGVAREVQVSAGTSGMPFIPVTTDTNIIKKLNPGESTKLSYVIQVKDKTEISSYSIPIRMEYKDENGKNISSQSYVGIRVLGRAELAIADIKIEPQNPAKGDIVTINMRIENSGTGEAKSVKVSLDAPFEGTKTTFLGKIKPDDDAPGVFTFYADKDGDIPYAAKIEFEDDLGARSVIEALNLHLHNANKNSIIAPVIAALLIIAGSVYYLQRRKKT